ncbi:MAG: GNAT family N-acetyltransferase [Acidobacteria bacterium]|nr:GNAT family N-acetyltransferase [Acidobacteriota bacterium]
MRLDEKPIIRPCQATEVATIEAIINQAAQAYRNVIPPDCWHEPYLRRSELDAEIADGVKFWGCEEFNHLVGIMGLQNMRGASLIRHAYVRPNHQHRGVGSALLTALSSQVTGRLLVGTWAGAGWAIRFYQRHGFRLVSEKEKDQLISMYWTIPLRQRQTSVVLVRAECPRVCANTNLQI